MYVVAKLQSAREEHDERGEQPEHSEVSQLAAEQRYQGGEKDEIRVHYAVRGSNRDYAHVGPVQTGSPDERY